MVYNVKKTDAKSFREVDWSKVDRLELSANDGVSETNYPTACQLCYNELGMFFNYMVTDDHVNCTMTGYNEHIWEEETVELFLQSLDTPKRYLELEWNGIGAVFCANIDNDLAGTADIDWIDENIMESEVFAEDYGWSVRGFIPRALFEGEFGGEWKFNAYRIKRRADKSMMLFAYRPMIDDYFHDPLKFATMTFEE